MSPEERVQFGRYLGQQAQQQGHDFIDLNQDGIDDRLQDPDYLARTTTQAHQKEPGLLGQLFGGSGGHSSGGTGSSMLSSPLAKGVLGGTAAYSSAGTTTDTAAIAIAASRSRTSSRATTKNTDRV